MRLLAFLALTAAAITIAVVQRDYSWLLAPVSVFLFLGLSPFATSKAPKAAVRRPVTGAAAGGAVGATGAVTAASWWADGHAPGDGKADARGAEEDGGCGGCGGCEA
ncbi:hypothetical protein ACFUN8_01015 [Streptomyces sp. NPDC057307]|uniref:hypothetical protein n=1 Tax=Streptomyces sp. NPDC057307 TaxID=3346096 RepID=UPI00362FDDE9